MTEPKQSLSVRCTRPLHGFPIPLDFPKLIVRSHEVAVCDLHYIIQKLQNRLVRHADDSELVAKYSHAIEMLFQLPYQNAEGEAYLTEFVEIPCGQCLFCRLNKSRIWASRCMLEYACHDASTFLTLTYDDEHVPTKDGYKVLRYSDVQAFNKRLNRYLNYRGLPSFRFFLCGEYGPTTLRPHYHGIYFGLDINSFTDWQKWYDTSHGHPSVTYVSPKLNSLWQNGRVNVGAVTFDSCAYVARYTVKPVDKVDELLHNPAADIVPEKLLMSRRPGIGMPALDDPKALERLVRDNKLYGSRGNGSSFTLTPPRSMIEYVRRCYPEVGALYDEKNPSRLSEMTVFELMLADNGALVVDGATDAELTRLEQFRELEEKMKEQQIVSLSRSKV